MTNRNFADICMLARSSARKGILKVQERLCLVDNQVDRLIRIRMKPTMAHCIETIGPRLQATQIWCRQSARRASQLTCEHGRKTSRSATRVLLLGAIVLFGVLAIRRARVVSAIHAYGLRLRQSLISIRKVFASIDLRHSTKVALRVLEFSLWIVAGLTLGYCGYVYGSATIHQTRERANFERAQNRKAERTTSLARAVATTQEVEPGGLLGILEIPRIGVSSIVDEGVDSKTLLRSVGHIPGTPLPGNRGNTGLAAHRDTYFRGLEDLSVGDVVTYRGASGTYTYAVRSMRIVDPSDIEVLAASNSPQLTLITCYPFHYVGNAPKRFVVIAQETSAND